MSCPDPNLDVPTSSSSATPDVTVNQNQEKRLFTDEMKFMKDFDPTQRSIAKKMKKFTNTGIIVETCDCLIPKCPGCHLPCKSCESRFCGHECRRARSWDYQEIEIQGGPTIQKRTKQ